MPYNIPLILMPGTGIKRRIFKTTYFVIKGIIVGVPTFTLLYGGCKQCFNLNTTDACSICRYVAPIIFPGAVVSYITPLVYGPQMIHDITGGTRKMYQIVTAPTRLTGCLVDRCLTPAEILMFGEPLPVTTEGFLTFDLKI